KKRDYLFVTKDWPSALEYMHISHKACEIFDYARAIISHGEEYIKVPRLDAHARPTLSPGAPSNAAAPICSRQSPPSWKSTSVGRSNILGMNDLIMDNQALVRLNTDFSLQRLTSQELQAIV